MPALTILKYTVFGNAAVIFIAPAKEGLFILLSDSLKMARTPPLLSSPEEEEKLTRETAKYDQVVSNASANLRCPSATRVRLESMERDLVIFPR